MNPYFGVLTAQSSLLKGGLTSVILAIPEICCTRPSNTVANQSLKLQIRIPDSRKPLNVGMCSGRQKKPIDTIRNKRKEHKPFIKKNGKLTETIRARFKGSSFGNKAESFLHNILTLQHEGDDVYLTVAPKQLTVTYSIEQSWLMYVCIMFMSIPTNPFLVVVGALEDGD